MAKHRRFSWESSTTREEELETEHAKGRPSSADLEQPDTPRFKGKGKAREQSAERNVEQSAEQSTASSANNTRTDTTREPSFQSRKDVPTATCSSSNPTMIVRPPTPMDPLRRTERQPSPLTHEAYKRDGWIVPDDSIHPSRKETPETVQNTSPGRQSRFDSAVEKNDEDLAHSSDEPDIYSVMFAHTWPRTRIRRNDHITSLASEDNAIAADEKPSNDTGFSNGTPPTPYKDENNPNSFGTWYCCMCEDSHAVLSHAEGPHLISPLSCRCSHRPCEECEFSGYIKAYCPVDEQPAVVHISESKDEQIKFGVICRKCGLSWRAQPAESVKKDTSKIRTVWHKISILPKKLNKTHSLQKLRQASVSMMNLSRPESSLSKMRSVADLRSVSDTKKNVETSIQEVGEQANSAKVRFFGILCACGHVTDSESFCFQITDVPWGTPQADLERQKVEIRQRVGSASPPDLQAKGHRDPFIHLKGGRHPHPLLSNPLEEFRRRTLYIGGQQLPGELTNGMYASGINPEYLARQE